MKSFIFFILGVAVGGASGYFVTKQICKAKAEAEIATATAEARNFYKDKYNEDSKKLDEKADKKAMETLTKMYQPGDTNRIFGNTYEVRDAVDYRSAEQNSNKNKPYLSLVDEDDLDIYDNYEQYSLDYYQDGTLVDEEGNPIDDPLEIAGDFLDDLSLENPEIHVSNDVTKTVYDICYVAASYEQPGGEYD